jgi:hypothetical protein
VINAISVHVYSWQGQGSIAEGREGFPYYGQGRCPYDQHDANANPPPGWGCPVNKSMEESVCNSRTDPRRQTCFPDLLTLGTALDFLRTGAAGHRRSSHLCTTLCISMAILCRKCTGLHELAPVARRRWLQERLRRALLARGRLHEAPLPADLPGGHRQAGARGRRHRPAAEPQLHDERRASAVESYATPVHFL